MKYLKSCFVVLKWEHCSILLVGLFLLSIGGAPAQAEAVESEIFSDEIETADALPAEGGSITEGSGLVRLPFAYNNDASQSVTFNFVQFNDRTSMGCSGALLKIHGHFFVLTTANCIKPLKNPTKEGVKQINIHRYPSLEGGRYAIPSQWNQFLRDGEIDAKKMTVARFNYTLIYVKNPTAGMRKAKLEAVVETPSKLQGHPDKAFIQQSSRTTSTPVGSVFSFDDYVHQEGLFVIETGKKKKHTELLSEFFSRNYGSPIISKNNPNDMFGLVVDGKHFLGITLKMHKQFMAFAKGFPPSTKE